MTLPAGIPFLIRSVLLLSIPPALVCCVIRVLQDYIGLMVPVWAAAIACVASIPVFLVSSVVLREWRIARDADKHGAALGKVWKGRSFGNIDVLNDFLFGLERGFLGQYCNH